MKIELQKLKFIAIGEKLSPLLEERNGCPFTLDQAVNMICSGLVIDDVLDMIGTQDVDLWRYNVIKDYIEKHKLDLVFFCGVPYWVNQDEA